MRHLFAALALAAPLAAHAATTDILIGIDGKTVFGPDGKPVNGASGNDSLLVMDVSDPAHPRIRASLPLENSVFGPPTNLQITPDGRLGLVADSITDTADGKGGYTAAPTDKLFVIDLSANPPALVQTVAIGKQPSGLSINHAGTLALVANRAGKSISVLSISGTEVKQVAEVPMGEEIAAVVITPDGKHAFAAKPQSAKVAVLDIDGTTVTTNKAQDIPVGLGVYNVDVTPDGHYVLAANTGTAGDGSSKTISTIDAQANPPRTIDTASTGDGPEGMAIAPDGKWVAVPLLLGTTASQQSWAYTQTGVTTLMALNGAGHLTLAATVPTGSIPEGVAWSPDSSFVYVGNYGDHDLSIYQVKDGALSPAATRFKLPGAPASMRGPAR